MGQIGCQFPARERRENDIVFLILTSTLKNVAHTLSWLYNCHSIHNFNYSGYIPKLYSSLVAEVLFCIFIWEHLPFSYLSLFKNYHFVIHFGS